VPTDTSLLNWTLDDLIRTQSDDFFASNSNDSLVIEGRPWWNVFERQLSHIAAKMAYSEYFLPA
jgi:hypothetical protein